MLHKDMATRLFEGLKRKTLTSCSRWSENYIYAADPFPGKMQFRYYPWTREMHDTDGDISIGQKAAQVGYTFTMMNRAFYTIDYRKQSVLYLLPSKSPDATDFSSTKFDPALEMSPYLEQMFSDVKNMGTKRAGSAILYIRGSNSRQGLKSISVSEVICDEFDEMPDHTVPLAQERMSGQHRKVMWLISTPRFPGEGINKKYLESTQEHYLFPCPSCSKMIELKHENLIVTAENIHDERLKDTHVICTECKAVLFGSDYNLKNNEDKRKYAELKATMLEKAAWVPYGHKDFNYRGFYVNQLYSPTVLPSLLGKKYLESLSNKSSEQEYHNSNMGEAHEVSGARISNEAIEACINKYGRAKTDMAYSTDIVTMGVDVGRKLHYEVTKWEISRMGNDINIMSKAIVLDAGTRYHFHELDALMHQFSVRACVVDVQPETRKALEFAKRFHGCVKLCRYGKNATDKTTMDSGDADDYIITVDRTTWLDLALGRFHNSANPNQPQIDLPYDIDLEYRTHMKNIARHYQEDKDGNQVGKYINNGDDHFAHARNYSEIALPYAAAIATNSNIGRYL
jgi:hypothetical protein